MRNIFTSCFAALLLAGSYGLAADPALSAPSAAQIAGWIRALDDENYAAREQAGRNLAAAGKAAIAPVAKAIASESPEMSWRANEVLEQIGISGDEETLELVSLALEEVARSNKGSLARSRSEVQQRWKLLRHERAVEQIARLGGKIRRGPDVPDGGMLFIGGFGGPVFGGGMMPAIAIEEAPIILDLDAAPAPKDLPAEGPKPDEPAREDEKALEDARALTPEGVFKALRREGGLFERIEAAEKTKRLFGPIEEPAKPGEKPKLLPGGKLGPVEIEFLPDIVPGIVPKKARFIPPPTDEPGTVEPMPLTEEPARIIEGKPVPVEERGGIFGAAFKALRELLPAGEPEFDPPAIEDGIRLVEDLPAMEFVPDAVEFVDVAMAVDLDAVAFWGEEGSAFTVSLGKEWKGGADGLKLLKDVMQLTSVEMSELDVGESHLSRLGELSELRQLNLQRCRFDRAALERLKKTRPELHVLTFGDAVLGVSGEAQGEGFHVSFVAPNSGAQAAGIQIGDILTTIGGEELRTFERLTHIIASHTTGEKLAVELVRQGKKQTLEVTLKAREASAP